jgi:uncharacterized protein
MSRTQVPTVSTDRIGALDVLRGIALLGMFLVHFNEHATGDPSRLSAAYQNAVALFFEERFWTMFGILFGVGFAVQLRRAEVRGGRFTALYVRRMLALAAFGFVAHAAFGFNVLLGYAVWGLPLLIVRNWSLKALTVALVLSAASGSLFSISRASYRVAIVGEESYRAERDAALVQNQTFNEANRQQQSASDYPAVFRARLRHMAWFYRQPFSFLPVNTFTLFLIGVVGLRSGLFDHPERHRRMIMGLMVFGAASWAAKQWLLPGPAPLGSPLVRRLIVDELENGFGIIRGTWLAFVYIGAVLLLAARNPAWLPRLSAFGTTGRMALTIYMVQIAILDLAFSEYALNLTLAPLTALAAGLAVFAITAALSRRWLSHFRFGPLEWLWRSVTYGRPQPWRVTSASTPVHAA